MDLKQWRELASDYIEGTLPAEKMKQVQAFLATSPEARTDEALLRGITRHLNDLPEVDPPLFFADNVIARIERENEAAQKRSWRGWLPNLGRVALGSALVGGALASVLWNFFYPKPTTVQSAGVVSGVSKTSASPAVVGPAPALKLSKLQPGNTAVSFSLALENAKSGTVRVLVPGAPQPTSVTLPTNRSLEVPIAEGMDVCTFKLSWVAEAVRGEQWVITPLEQELPATTRLSFGGGELPLTPQGLEDLAKRYGQGITVIDIPQSDRKVQFDARNETLEELLTRHLGPLGMAVTRVENRVVVIAKP